MRLKATRNLLVLALVLVAVRLFLGLSPIEQLFRQTVSPISGAIETLVFNDTTKIDSEQNFAAEIEELEQTNDELRDQLKLSENFVTAEVTSKNITGFRKTMTINQGSDAGLKEGQAVISDNYLVGRISRVTPMTALVQLITDPEFKVTATPKDGVGGVVKSDSGSLVFDLVPANDQEGELVSTDGVDGQFKPGISIGVLGDRISSDNRTFHTYHLLLGLSLESLELVEVDKSGTQ